MTAEIARKSVRSPLSPGCADWDNRIGFIACRSGASILERDDVSSNRHPILAFCLRMIFPENRYPPRIKSGAGSFRIMLCPTMAQAESKKNARLPDEACGKICGTVMTSGKSSGSAAPGGRRCDLGRTFIRITLWVVGGLLCGLLHEAKKLAVHGFIAGGDIAFG